MHSATFAAGVCLSLSGSCLAQTSTAAISISRVETRIPPQALGSALEKFEQLDHIQVLYLTAAVRDLRTLGASGYLTADETLTRLLSGTSLTYRYVDTNAVSIIYTSQNTHATRNASARKKALHQGQTSPIRKTAPTAGDPDPSAVPIQKPIKSSAKSKLSALQEVIVTGTHISGQVPAYSVTTITRTQILQSGLGSVSDVLNTSPQVFSGGVNPGALQVGGNASQLGDAGTGVSNANILGIGNSATLTLIDGHRLAGSGADSSSSADLSMIPIVAVQEIQIQTGGSSAIYGSDAVAGVVNVILRKDYNGAETSGYVGWTQGGGSFTQRYSQLVGQTFDQGSVLLAGEFSNSDPLRADQRATSSAAGAAQYLEEKLKSEAVMLHTDYSPTARLRVHALGLYSHRTSFLSEVGSQNPSRIDEFASDAGADYQFSGDRNVGIDVIDSGFSQLSYFISPPCPCGPPLVQTTQNSLLGTDLHASGRAATLPTGDVLMAVGAEVRRQNFDIDGNAAPPESASRRVFDAYLEANIPLVPHSLNRIGLEDLGLDMAGNYNHYSDFGSATTPMLGLVYRPLQRITAKATYGRSFVAPPLDELASPRTVGLFPGSLFGGGAPGSIVMLESGGNRQLGPETAQSFTGAIQFASEVPQLNGHFRAAATYDYIDFSHLVQIPITAVTQALVSPVYKPFVIINPTVNQQNDAIAMAGGQEDVQNYFSLPYVASNVSALLENEYQNISVNLIHALSANLEYSWNSKLGGFAVTWAGTWLRIDDRLLPGASPEQISGEVSNPPDFKMRGSLGWHGNALSAITFVNHISSEQLQLFGTGAPSYNISGWTTVDAQIGYSLGRIGSRASAHVSFSITNVFNAAPPKVPDSALIIPVGFDTYNASAVGRMFVLAVTTDW